jgi:hypothetical protein
VHVLGFVCANESNLSLTAVAGAGAAEEIPAEEIHEEANLTFSDPQDAFYVEIPSALKIMITLCHKTRLHRLGPFVRDR